MTTTTSSPTDSFNHLNKTSENGYNFTNGVDVTLDTNVDSYNFTDDTPDNETEEDNNITTSATTRSKVSLTSAPSSQADMAIHQRNSPSGDDSLAQVKATQKCIGFVWTLFQNRPLTLKLNLTNTLTGEKSNQLIDVLPLYKEVCNLREHQRYYVELTSLPCCNQPGETRTLYMWTQQAIPDYPPTPTVKDTTDKTITLQIFQATFDLEKGPFTGFDIKIIETAELDNYRKRRQAHGVPPGNSVGFLKNNEDQEFIIGSNELNASTSSINIYLIIMFICILLGLTLILYCFIYIVWSRKKEKEDALRKEREALMLYLGDYNKEVDGSEDGDDEDDDEDKELEEDSDTSEARRNENKVFGILGSPEVVGPYVQMRHPWIAQEENEEESSDD